MRKLFTIGAMLLAGTAFAQTENVGIGTKSPDESAILDLSSNKKGFLLPRMSESQRKSIVKPAQGLQVYQTDQKSGLYIFNGSDWTNAANSVMAASDPWLRGGSDILPGEFIGTKTGGALVFKVNNVPSGRIEPGQNTFFGYLSGDNSTGALNTGFGYATLRNSVGLFNTAFGTEALSNTTIGYGNTALGAAALSANTTGVENFGLGAYALFKNNGSNNVALGYKSMFNATGATNNLAIGSYALENLITGSGNVAIGGSAGQNELGSNKLYIANSNTVTPLIYGDFAAKYVTIGDVSPALRVQALSLSGGYNLLVKGGILTEKVKVALAQAGTDWADYVFEPEYKNKMMSLEEVENYTLLNKHLPNVPSAKDMVSNGLDVAQTSKMFMEKIEELTLYIIELNKEIKKLKEGKN